MIALAVLAVLVGIAVRHVRRSRGVTDTVTTTATVPAEGRGGRGGAGWLLASAAHLFPPGRQEWAQAMLAELDEVDGAFARWRFALGGAWTGLVASGRETVPPGWLAAVVAVAAAVGAVAYAVAPATHVFAVALAIVLVLAGISWPRRRARAAGDAGATGGGAVLGVTLLAGVAGCVALTLYGVAAYPDAAPDDGVTALYSLVLAAVLGCYVWVALGGWPASGDREPAPSAPAARPAALGVVVGLAVGAGVAVVGVFADRSGALAAVPVAGVCGLSLAGALGAHLARRGTPERGVVAAGLRTGLVAGVAYFVAGMSTTYLTASWPVHQQEVLEYFRASRFDDLATFLVSDALGGSIAALVGFPVVVLGATWAGGALARRPVPAPPPPASVAPDGLGDGGP